MANTHPHTPSSRNFRCDGLARLVQIPAGRVDLEAELALPPAARGLVLFAHGSGSSRKNPRNQRVAQVLRRRGLGCLLFDALTPSERRQDAIDERLRFDVGLLSRRLIRATDWARTPALGALPIGYFGASVGAAAALVAAAERPDTVRAVVCRGGRPDLAAGALRRLRAPTLLIVGSEDPATLECNELALAHLSGVARLEIVPGAGHLFEEPGVLELASELAGDWFVERFAQAAGLASEPR
jgi:pimeloyl-ACP methyl ester carboxylesterase